MRPPTCAHLQECLPAYILDVLEYCLVQATDDFIEARQRVLMIFQYIRTTLDAQTGKNASCTNEREEKETLDTTLVDSLAHFQTRPADHHILGCFCNTTLTNRAPVEHTALVERGDLLAGVLHSFRGPFRGQSI